jgi:hypothetical protein
MQKAVIRRSICTLHSVSSTQTGVEPVEAFPGGQMVRPRYVQADVMDLTSQPEVGSVWRCLGHRTH